MNKYWCQVTNSDTCRNCVFKPKIGRPVKARYIICKYKNYCEICGKYLRLVAHKSFYLTVEEHEEFIKQTAVRNWKRENNVPL